MWTCTTVKWSYNFKEAQERAKKQVASLERQASMLAASGDTNKLHRTQKEIERIKAWEAKMAKEEKRFQEGRRMDGGALPPREAGDRGRNQPSHRPEDEEWPVCSRRKPRTPENRDKRIMPMSSSRVEVER